MSNDIKIENNEKEITKIRESYEDEYWSKKYGVTAEELKKEGNSVVGIYNKIISANFKKKVFTV